MSPITPDPDKSHICLVVSVPSADSESNPAVRTAETINYYSNNRKGAVGDEFVKGV